MEPGLLWELNPELLAPKARIIQLDQAARCWCEDVCHDLGNMWRDSTVHVQLTTLKFSPLVTQLPPLCTKAAHLAIDTSLFFYLSALFSCRGGTVEWVQVCFAWKKTFEDLATLQHSIRCESISKCAF